MGCHLHARELNSNHSENSSRSWESERDVFDWRFRLKLKFLNSSPRLRCLGSPPTPFQRTYAFPGDRCTRRDEHKKAQEKSAKTYPASSKQRSMSWGRRGLQPFDPLLRKLCDILGKMLMIRETTFKEKHFKIMLLLSWFQKTRK